MPIKFLETRSSTVIFPLPSFFQNGNGDGSEAATIGGGTGSDGEEAVRQVVVGICAMEKKSRSKPMGEILTRLEEFEYIKTTIFPEKVILNVSVSRATISSNEVTAIADRVIYFYCITRGVEWKSVIDGA